jgi:hypothetical protein
MSDTLRRRGVDACERLGYTVDRPDRGPPAVGVAGPDARPLPGGRRPDRIAVEPLDSASVTPTMLISRLWNDRANGRAALFVVPEAALESALSVLSPPAFVRARTDAGHRTFYDGPDRVPLAEGGYAAVRTDARRLAWVEEPATGPLDAAGPGPAAGGDASGAREARSRNGPSDAEGDGPRLVLQDGDAVLAVLDGVDALSCPPADRFPYAYRRGEDKRFHVTDRDGREVGVYDSVTAMRANAYHPVAMPLVPEHVFADVSERPSLRRSWVLVGVDDEGRTGQVHTADGSAPLPDPPR